MKHLKTFEARRSALSVTKKIPSGYHQIDIRDLKLIDPFDLSYFEDVEDSIYFYNKSKVKSHSYDDKWGWVEIWTLEDDAFKKECGYIIFKNDEPLYVVGIYEPKSIVPSTSNAASQIGGLFTVIGYESMINLWLDYGEYDAHR